MIDSSSLLPLRNALSLRWSKTSFKGFKEGLFFLFNFRSRLPLRFGPWASPERATTDSYGSCHTIASFRSIIHKISLVVVFSYVYFIFQPELFWHVLSGAPGLGPFAGYIEEEAVDCPDGLAYRLPSGEGWILCDDWERYYRSESTLGAIKYLYVLTKKEGL